MTVTDRPRHSVSAWGPGNQSNEEENQKIVQSTKHYLFEETFNFVLHTINMCSQQPIAHFMFFSFPKYPRERFENANICISPTFQETVESHLKSSLPVVAMATLNQFNSNIFLVSVNNIPLAKISQYIIIHTYCNLNSFLLFLIYASGP